VFVPLFRAEWFRLVEGASNPANDANGIASPGAGVFHKLPVVQIGCSMRRTDLMQNFIIVHKFIKILYSLGVIADKRIFLCNL